MRFDGKTVLVTGGASGIGRAVAAAFSAEGARVAIFDRARGSDENILAIQGDVRSMDDNRRAVAETLDAFGSLDVLIANAGIFDNNIRLEDLAEEDTGPAFDELFGIDVKGYVLAAKASIPYLRESRGALVFTASVSGVHPAFGGTLYVPAKHAIVGLTKRLALEFAPDVRVNAVAPGFVPTALSGSSVLAQQSKGAARSADGFLMKRVPTIEDYVPLYLFLASSDALTMTGQTLFADNGATLVRG